MADLTDTESVDCLERELRKKGTRALTTIDDVFPKVESGEMSLRDAMREWALAELFRFINGDIYPHYKGITTYTRDEEHHRKLHEGCLELERRGKIGRHFEEDDFVVWKPVHE